MRSLSVSPNRLTSKPDHDDEKPLSRGSYRHQTIVEQSPSSCLLIVPISCTSPAKPIRYRSVCQENVIWLTINVFPSSSMCVFSFVFGVLPPNTRDCRDSRTTSRLRIRTRFRDSTSCERIKKPDAYSTGNFGSYHHIEEPGISQCPDGEDDGRARRRRRSAGNES